MGNMVWEITVRNEAQKLSSIIQRASCGRAPRCMYWETWWKTTVRQICQLDLMKNLLPWTLMRSALSLDY